MPFSFRLFRITFSILTAIPFLLHQQCDKIHHGHHTEMNKGIDKSRLFFNQSLHNIENQHQYGDQQSGSTGFPDDHLLALISGSEHGNHHGQIQKNQYQQKYSKCNQHSLFHRDAPFAFKVSNSFYTLSIRNLRKNVNSF